MAPTNEEWFAIVVGDEVLTSTWTGMPLVFINRDAAVAKLEEVKKERGDVSIKKCFITILV